MRGTRAGIAGLLVAAVLAGCGSSSNNEKSGLTSGQARSLVAQLEAARASAAARDLAGTQAAVGRFRASVAQLRRSGALSDATARSLRIGASRLLQRVRSDGPPPPQAAPQTTPAPAPLPPGKAKKHDKKKDKHGKGKGHGEGD